MIFRKLDIKVKMALVYSLILLFAGIAVAGFLSLALQLSMKNQPVTGRIENIAYSIAVTDSDTTYTYSLPAEAVSSDVIKLYGSGADGAAKSYSITGEQLNSFLSSEIFLRLVKYSAVAVAIILVCAVFIGYKVSKWLLKPLTAMAKTTHSISAENMDLRLAIPESNDELRELSISFNTAMDGLQKAFFELERFNSYASHELKNALAVLKTRLEVDYNTADCRETVGFAITHVDRIAKSINDILAISATGIKDGKEAVDLALAAAQAVDEYKLTGRNITLDIPDEGVSPVKGKEIWFQRVIANLLDNAVKHTEAGSAIHVAVKESCGAVIVSVSDSGCGIEASEQKHIWEPYFSTGPDWKKGYGLGLAMVNHIVDICGGLVWVESQKGQGSTFYISLPAVSRG